MANAMRLFLRKVVLPAEPVIIYPDVTVRKTPASKHEWKRRGQAEDNGR
jgi:hypothetical protein